jgi:preprotein translocase subunit YajC
MDAILSVLPLLVVLLLVYLFGIRPRQRKMARHAQMIRDLRAGDSVVTSGGISGHVVALKGNSILVEVAPGVRFDIDPGKIESVAARAEIGAGRQCPKCGGPLASSDRFCGNCGAPC